MEQHANPAQSAGTVSVVIPAYNRRTLVLATLESVRAQTFTDLEVIVVDDGSTDGTPTEVARWIAATGDGRFRLKALPVNGGKPAAVNTGFRQIHGKFVIVLDSDDILLPDALSREVEFLARRTDVGMVAAKAYVMRGSKLTGQLLGGFEGVSECADLVGIYGDLLLNGNPIVASTVLLRAEVVRDIGDYNPRLSITHDWEYWIRVAQRHRIGFIGVPVINYRTGHAGTSSGNRVRTFREICGLLFAADVGRASRVAAVRRQVRYNLWLAYHDEDPWSFLTIGALGVGAMFRALVSGSKS